MFALSGEIDLSNCREVEADLLRAIDESPLRIVRIDCGTLEFIDSSGLHVLIRVERSLEARGRSLVLTAVPDHLRQLLEIIDFDHLVEPAPVAVRRSNRHP